MLSPTARKTAPRFNASQVAAMCGVERGQIAYRLTKGDLPSGTPNESGARREFTLAETRAWVRAYRPAARRPEHAEACVLTIANFKGGVVKLQIRSTLNCWVNACTRASHLPAYSWICGLLRGTFKLIKNDDEVGDDD